MSYYYGASSAAGKAQAAAFTPADLPNIAFTFEGDAGVTDAGGGAVSQWADQSGNGNHLTQATAGLRPTTGTRTINGVNAIDFDGTESLVMGSAAGITSVAYVWLVLVVDVIAAGTDYIVHAGGGNNENGFHYRTPGEGDGNLAINNNSATRDTVTFLNLWTFGTAALHRLRWNGTTIMGVKLSGQTEATNTPAVGCATPENIRLMALDGVSDFVDGAVAAFGACTSDLTGTQDETDLLAYLNAKYGVAA